MRDQDSESVLALLSEHEKIRSNRVPGVRSTLVVLSSRGMVYDVESLRQKIHLSYPESAVFFRTTRGDSVGAPSPKQVDLLIDLTGPGQKQGILYARGLRRTARIAVGRNSGLFRKGLYDRIFDEKGKMSDLPRDLLARERIVQRNVLSLAGVALAQHGDVLVDKAQSIALELPRLKK